MELLNHVNNYYEFLPLGVFDNKSEDEVKNLIATLYSNDYTKEWRSKINKYKPHMTQKEIEDTLANLNILIAYQSKCKSGSRYAFFVFKHKETRQIYEMQIEFDSKSCEGYEGSFNIVEIDNLSKNLNYTVIEYDKYDVDIYMNKLENYITMHPIL